ncbi:hypothetical protein DJ71_13675, partial [Halorubrum sp. E3]
MDRNGTRNRSDESEMDREIGSESNGRDPTEAAAQTTGGERTQTANGETTQAAGGDVPVSAFREAAARLADGDLGARFPTEDADGE